jgi:flavin-dependent dehydrogenase
LSALLDVAVVGGGPAGMSTALHLHAIAPQLNIAVLERGHFPRDKYCAGGIGHRALSLLSRIGVYPDVPRVTFDTVAVHLPGRRLEVTRPSFRVVVRRIEFDHFLARQAQQRGIDVREGCDVREVAADEDGVELRLASGARVRARVGTWQVRRELLALGIDPQAGSAPARVCPCTRTAHPLVRRCTPRPGIACNAT